jgi:hypothetical protein
MDRKPSSDQQLAELGEFQGTIDRSSNFRQQALDHNLGRNSRVAKLLGYIALMRQAGANFGGSVDCVAAAQQNFQSPEDLTHLDMPAGVHQAAHFLPGQVTIGGRRVQQFASNPRTQGHIEFLFGEVEHLPVVFNQADSAGEAKGRSIGLCAALSRGCATLITRPMTGKGPIRPGQGAIPMDLVQAGYEDWYRDSLTALRNAINSKESKVGIPALVGNRFDGYTPESIAARSNATQRQWNRDQSLRILQYYLEDQQQRSWRWVSGLQFVWREVLQGFAG